MSNPSSENEGVHLLADFRVRAIPLSPNVPMPDRNAKPSHTSNEGVHHLADFRDVAIPISEVRAEASQPGDEDGQVCAESEWAELSPLSVLESIAAAPFIHQLRANPQSFAITLKKVILPFIQQQSRREARKVAPHDEEFVDELASEATANLLYNSPEPAPEQSLSLVRWLGRRIRASAHRLVAERTPNTGLLFGSLDSSVSAESEVEASDWATAFYARIDKQLDRNDKLILQCWAAGKTQIEIAAELKVHVATIRNRLHRLFKTIRDLFEPHA